MKLRLTIPFLFFCSKLTAAIYYVDIDTGDDTAAGTSTGTAWQHMPGSPGITGTGWTTLTDGDTLVVKGGSINTNQVKITPVYYSGSMAFDSIKIQSGHIAETPWGTGRAVIDGSIIDTNASYGIWLSGTFAEGTLNGVTLDGFEIRNIPAGAPGAGFSLSTGSSCIAVGGSYVTTFLKIQDNYLHDALRAGDDQGHGIEFAGSTNFIIAHNIIGTNIATKGIEPYRCRFGVISNNFISGTWDHCIALTTCSNIDVVGNLLLNVPPWIHEPVYSIAMSGAWHCDVWNNLAFVVPPVTQSFDGTYSSKAQMGIGMYTTCVSNRVAFNTFAFFNDHSNGGNSTSIRFGDSSPSYTNLATYFGNNLSYSNDNFFGSQLLIRTNEVQAINIATNLFWRDTSTNSLMAQWDGSSTFYTNVPDFSISVGTFTGNVQIEPILTYGSLPAGLDSSYHPDSDYFALHVSTPVEIRVTGLRLSGIAGYGFSSDPDKFATDIRGVPRQNWSMGAYEFVSYELTRPKTFRGRGRGALWK